MKQTILLLLLLLCTTVSVQGINYMNLLCEIEENREYDDLGNGLAALDFNGDGYDDLAVLQPGWVPDSLISNPPNYRYGKLLFYYGGPGFDNVADFTIEGTYNYHLAGNAYGSYLADLGDVNGDGFEDLGLTAYTDFTGEPSENARPYIAVYFGGQNPSTQPGYYKMFPSLHSGNGAGIDPLGDVNHDNIADFIYEYAPNTSYEELGRSVIVLGGSMTELLLRQYSPDDAMAVHPSGDVNHDGYDDYTATFIHELNPGTYTYSNTLYFGSTSVLPADSLLLYSGPLLSVVRTNYLGDINGDGLDDFCGRCSFPNTYIWYGNENISPQYNLVLSPNWSGNGNTDRGLVHGDLNNDGYDDVIGSDPMNFGYNGSFRIWLGGTNMNGTSDLTINGTYTGMQMGMSMAAGDFNADGNCDVAASAPHSPGWNSSAGKVFVFAGNAQLADTTVINDDDIAGQPPDSWSIKVIPNPVSGRQDWKLRFTGKGYERYGSLTVKIFNLKGQLNRTFKLYAGQVKAGEADLPHLNLPAGVYEVSLYQKGNLLKTRKMTIQ
jgi:hypothetical protein